nr:MAG: hypothetical protein [Rhabdoviridae sp.]
MRHDGTAEVSTQPGPPPQEGIQSSSKRKKTAVPTLPMTRGLLHPSQTRWPIPLQFDFRKPKDQGLSEKPNMTRCSLSSLMIVTPSSGLQSGHIVLITSIRR